MEVAVDVEERKGLDQEIKEAGVRNSRNNDEDSGDEWVDHSDMEDNLKQQTLEPHKESLETLVLQLQRNESEERNEKYHNFCSD